MVKAGDVVNVRVKEVDVARNRIGLSMKSSDGPSKNAGDQRGALNDGRNDSRAGGGKSGGPSKGRAPEPQKETVHSPFAQLAKVKLG